MQITNHGPIIVASDYWGSEVEKAGKAVLSPNGGAIRILLPSSERRIIPTLLEAEYTIVSVGPWTEIGGETSVEVVWEDHTDTPYTMLFNSASCLGIPGEPEPGREWIVTVWESRKGRPHKAVERRCFWRRVDRIPCMRPWEGEI